MLPEQAANERIPARAHAPRQTTTSQYVRSIASQQTQRWADTDEALDGIEDNPHFYPARRSSSAIRYIDKQGNPVLQAGKKRYVLHQEKPKKNVHGLFLIGVGMLLMIGLGVGFSAFGKWWNTHQLYAAYGFPRTWQTDVNVGHEQGKSHFLFENLGGHVFFEEIPEGNDFKHAVVYPVTSLFGPDAANTPVTATFEDVNHDGRLDIILHVGNDTNIVYLNTGNGFKPAQ